MGSGVLNLVSLLIGSTDFSSAFCRQTACAIKMNAGGKRQNKWYVFWCSTCIWRI